MTGQEQHDIFHAWMRDHAGILHKVARLYEDCLTRREDLIQEIQIAIWHALPTFRKESEPSSYIYRIALNRALSWVRRERAYRRKVAAYEHEGIEHSDGEDTEDPRLEAIYAAIRRLPKADRALILLQLEGFRYEEIAGTLGISPTNVGARLTRIRQKLARMLTDIPSQP